MSKATIVFDVYNENHFAGFMRELPREQFPYERSYCVRSAFPIDLKESLNIREQELKTQGQMVNSLMLEKCILEQQLADAEKVVEFYSDNLGKGAWKAIEYLEKYCKSDKNIGDENE